MSLVRILFRHPIMETMQPFRMMEQHFRAPMRFDDFISPISNEMRAMMQRHEKMFNRTFDYNESEATMCMDKDKFQVNLDVQQYQPSEITVKITGKNEITVEGNHESTQDDKGFISRHFVRKYVVPDGYDMDNVGSELTSDGKLSIFAVKCDSPAVEHRDIHITQTGKPAIEREIAEKKENVQ